MIYKVTKQFNTVGAKEQLCQHFKTEPDATAFAREQAEADAGMRIQTTYRVYEFDDLLTTFDSTKIQPSTQTGDSAGSQGKTSGARFSPSPLQNSPRPPGTAPKVWIDPEEDKDKNK